ncbi:MAG: PIN domain-containing protein [Thermomicrobiales bacterium]|nr:PIN domain-containing protein [Thermomicrobiales bacterium]MCO5224816.1 PIN domain-containing protein [Thermomicrobiales bacterium]
MTRMIFWIADTHEAIITPYIANELLEKTIAKEPLSLPSVIAFLESTTIVLLDDNPDADIDAPLINDPKDQEILNAAIYHHVDIIISGDKHFRNLNITRPRIHGSHAVPRGVHVRKRMKPESCWFGLHR